MKTILLLITTLATIALATAREVNIAWNPNPPEEQVTAYRVYIRDSADPEKFNVHQQIDIAPGEDTIGTIVLPNSDTAIVLTAVNSAGLESEPSAVLEIPAAPSEVIGLELGNNAKVTITIEATP
ncbi:MAG: hypothetical protein ACPG32_15665 [Akkermansiaceae bacterium]